MHSADLQNRLDILFAPHAELVEAWRIGRRDGASFDRLRMRPELGMRPEMGMRAEMETATATASAGAAA